MIAPPISTDNNIYLNADFMHSNANNESISIVRDENICRPLRTCVRCKIYQNGRVRGERGEMVSVNNPLPGGLSCPSSQATASISTRVYLIDRKIKVARARARASFRFRFPEIWFWSLRAGLVIHMNVLVVSGFMHQSSPEIKKITARHSVG